MSNNLDKQYKSILHDILYHGYKKKNRTACDTFSVFNREIRHKMSEGFPLLTTKRVPFKTAARELMWYLSGSSDIRDLWKRKVYVWDGDWFKNYKESTSSPYSLEEMKEFAEKGAPFFHDSVWDLGPIYGSQWKRWGESRDKKGIDQISALVSNLIENPYSRRLLVNAWNVEELPNMTLPPCHFSFECWTRPLSLHERFVIFAQDNNEPVPRFKTDEEYHEFYSKKFIPEFELSLKWNQRSADFPLGVPFNLVCYGLLLLMLADEVRMVPGELVGSFTDCHIYENQIEGVEELLTREPLCLPTVTVRDGLFSSVESDYDIELEHYKHHPTINFPLTN